MNQPLNLPVTRTKKIGGILIIAGKGHEETQTYKNKSFLFNDKIISSNYAKYL